MKIKLTATLVAAGIVGIALLQEGNGPDKPRPETIRVSTAVASLSAPVAHAQPSAAQADSLSLPHPTLEPEGWLSQSMPAGRFTEFAAWAMRFTAADTTERNRLEAEGIVLARRRLGAMADLVRSNPRRALELSVPEALRRRLPPAVQALLEQPVNTRGDYEVVCVLPIAGSSHAEPELVRSATIDGARHRVFTYGRALDYLTRANAPLNGIAVPAEAATPPVVDAAGEAPALLLALNPQPARWLSEEEMKDRLAPGHPECTRCGTIAAEPVALELGGEAHFFCDVGHAAEWAEEAVAAEHLEAPEPPTSTDLPVAESGYTEGVKRLLFMRVGFPDYTNTIGNSTAVTRIGTLSNYFATMSYGKFRVADAGANGSAVTPIMQMPNPSSHYDNAGLSRLYPDAKAAAKALGYNLGDYHFLVVFTAGSKPSYSYAGLAYVGGVGVHIANGYWSNHTLTHELGHNLGLPHAKRWDTADQSMIGSGSNVEYGDYYDQMGTHGDDRQHYNSSHKNVIDWIPDRDIQTAGSGTRIYRLYVQDRINSTGLRGLKASRNSSKDYWAEFRQLWSDRDIRNGLILHWADKNGKNTVLLDTLPGVDGDGLAIGRTFSDFSAEVHITPLGRGKTDPDWMDVAVTVGRVATNQAPVAMVRADRATASTGQSVNFSALAWDDNGDTLAYYWEFGDGSYSVSSDPEVSHSYGSAGEYSAQCTVSDLKGGTARDSALVRVGSPGTYRISGRVLDPNGRPVVGIRVSAGSYSAFTDSDGTYTLAGLSAKSYTVSAREIVKDDTSFSKPFFSNPVRVGPDFAGADFIAGDSPPAVYTTLIATNASWRYSDRGIDLGTAWRSLSYADGSWSNGPAMLGYGNGDEATLIDYGSEANDKHPTYYFRKVFSLANPSSYGSYVVDVLRDDGVVVYLNGTEVFRDNLPTGAIAYATTALDALEPGVVSFTLPPSAFVAGNNIFAVEVHQASRSSSDIAFALGLSGLSPTSTTGLKLVYLSSPSDWDTVASPTNVNLTGTALAEGATATRVEFFVNNLKIGEDTAAPFALVWTNATVGTNALHLLATFNTGVHATSAPVSLVVEPGPSRHDLVIRGAQWRYYAAATAPAGNWIHPRYDDSAWPAGPAELGYGDNDESTLIPYGSEETNKWIASYYRRAFTIADAESVTNLTLELKRDDGAIVYLNGEEVVRDGLDAGPVTWSTLANNTVSGSAESAFYVHHIDPRLLRPGTNVLAVEIHQRSPDSSDISFDLSLTGYAITNRPRGAWLTSPTDGANYDYPATLELSAEVVAGGTLGVANVEFLATVDSVPGGMSVGRALSYPWTFLWTNPPPGLITLTPVAQDSAGGVIIGRSIAIMHIAPAPARALVSFGEDWKYLDTGAEPATNWTELGGFDDRLWPRGPAQLGYGDGDEGTVIGYGPDPGAKFITAWFRKKFYATNAAAFSGLRLRLLRDDGVAVYLNGEEVFRDNLPEGPLTSLTTAQRALGGADETTPINTVILNTLREGENQLAVELHQNRGTSSDLSFDLALAGLVPTNLFQGAYLTSPAAGEHFTGDLPLEVFANGPAPVARVEYSAGAQMIGEATAAPFAGVWTNAPFGSHQVSALVRLEDGTVYRTPPVTIVVEPQKILARLASAASEWLYRDDGAYPGTAWRDAGYDDSGWSNGLPKFGFGDPDNLTLLRSNNVLGTRIITYYFRLPFVVPADLVPASLELRMIRDDGAVIYLNGEEVLRDNMSPSEIITHTTLALGAVGGTNESNWFVFQLEPGLLRGGANLLAAEVHQNSTNSSDLGFALELAAIGYPALSIPPAPPALAVAPTSDGQLQLFFPELDGRIFVIESSADLRGWTPEATNSVWAGRMDYDLDPASTARRFFRVRWQR